MLRVVLVVSIFLAPAAPAGGVTGSGLYGVVMRGPITPVCVAEQPCSKPAVGVTLSFIRGARVKSVITNALGRYRVALVPGTYAVRTGSGITIGRGLEPRTAIVPAAWKRQGFSIDTGIR
jgi:hypothetical protein